MLFESHNPYTETVLSSYEFEDAASLINKIENAQKAFESWKKSSFVERAALFLQLKALLEQHAERLGKLAAEEMGKLAIHASAEVLKSASLCSYYAANAQQILATTIEKADELIDVHISHEPLGIILGVFPWNFPYWQILRSALPTVMSGNVMLVKPAPNVPRCSLALQELIDEAGFPKGVIQTVFASNEQVGELLKNTNIKAVSLTGSERAGSMVAALAASQIKPSVLELGGSDPLIILNDAPLDEIIDQVVFSRFQNNGQSCVAAKRFLVQTELKEKFEQLLIQKVSALKLGNPLEKGADIGPLARKDLKELLAMQVEKSIAAGANILYQQNQIPAKGWFFPPTVLINVPKATVAYEEELFGPVVSIFYFEKDEEAISIANDTRFGLGASIYSKNQKRAMAMAAAIESGMVYINTIVKSDVRYPFGGIKSSGYGRELGPQGLKAFTQTKTIWIKQ
jgi:succinate-semialdehyde dehydrogenase/glutarate-semialdehyde dehydrogenase